jgi:hypothetical protein
MGRISAVNVLLLLNYLLVLKVGPAFFKGFFWYYIYVQGKRIVDKNIHFDA